MSIQPTLFSVQVVRIPVLAGYFLALVFGGGVHLHRTLALTDNNEQVNGRTFTLHAHGDQPTVSADHVKSGTLFNKHSHQHNVPLLQIIGISNTNVQPIVSSSSNSPVTCSMYVADSGVRFSLMPLATISPQSSLLLLLRLFGNSLLRAPPTA